MEDAIRRLDALEARAKSVPRSQSKAESKHVQNYETFSEPSESQVPLMAQPKTLEVSRPFKK